MDKQYKVVITEIGENGAEKVVHDEMHSGMTCLFDSPDGEGFSELVLNDSVGNMATKIADSKHMKRAAKLAAMFAMLDKGNSDSEAE